MIKTKKLKGKRKFVKKSSKIYEFAIKSPYICEKKAFKFSQKPLN